MSPDLAGAQRLADAVKARRDERGWTQQDVVQQGRLSLNRLQAIEAGRTAQYRRTTLEDLDRGLKWAQGSAARTLNQEGAPSEADPAGRGHRCPTTYVDAHSRPASDIVAGNVRNLRLSQRLSVAKLAEQCEQLGAPDLTYGSLANLERGQVPTAKRTARKVTVDDLFVLAKALGTTPEHLLRHDDGDDLTVLYGIGMTS